MSKSTAETNREIAASLSNNLSRLLREFSRDFERRIWQGLVQRGYQDIRPSHSAVLANLGLGAVRVTELAERARVTQQAMGKMLKELERLGYVTRGVDRGDRRAREIKLTARGERLASDSRSVGAEVRAAYADKVGLPNSTCWKASCAPWCASWTSTTCPPPGWSQNQRRSTEFHAPAGSSPPPGTIRYRPINSGALNTQLFTSSRRLIRQPLSVRRYSSTYQRPRK